MKIVATAKSELALIAVKFIASSLRLDWFRFGSALIYAFLLCGLTACNMSNLPRNMNLKSFNPQRTGFTCVHEAAKLPPVTAEAERLFQQGLLATSYDLWPNQRNYKLAAQLWQQAAAKGHWKAAMNLAGLYESGLGVQRDTEHAVLLIEGLLTLDVPAAFDKMGTYHQSGIGVKRDIDRAYGFWQLAAESGSPAAQTFIGKKLDAAYDSETMGVWANRSVALKMLNCAFAQGYGKAAFELGVSLNIGDGNHARALTVLHEGVKFGSEDAAGYLSASFGQLEPLSGNLIDTTRAERYSALSEALELNPDLRFPNLDKVLPLPPASLPFWDGKPETLIDAAKAVVIKTSARTTPGAKLTGRAHIPEGYVLPRTPQLYLGREILAQYESTSARAPGYWLAQSIAGTEAGTRFNQAALPLRYQEREPFEDMRAKVGPQGGRILWHYLGEPVKQAAARIHPYVAQGRARYVPEPATPSKCRGTRPCPATGIWRASLPDSHTDFATFYSHFQQAYVLQGQPFPVPVALHEAGGLTVQSTDITWHWMGQANRDDGSGRVDISLGA